MALRETNLSTHLHDEPLTTINGIKFTNREIDIITLIFHTRGSSKIACLLSISTRTVETHIANIMRKIDANSREGIIDFVEKSGHASWVKKHYRNLLIDIDFRKQLREIYKLIRNQALMCTFISGHEEESHFIALLKDHLALCGIQIMLREGGREQTGIVQTTQYGKHLPIHHTLYLVPKRLGEKFHLNKEECQQEIIQWTEQDILNPQTVTFILYDKDHPDVPKGFGGGIPCISFGSQEEYYLAFFEILKRIVPHINLDKTISEFKDKHGGDVFEEPALTLACPEDFTKKNAVFRNTTIGSFIIILLFGLWVFKHDIFSPKHPTNIKPEASIRSDLVIPTGNTFLDRPLLIDKIAKSLKDNGGIQTVALVGIGGAGKTTIARKYALLQNASVVWEINAVTRGSLRDSFERLAYALCKCEEDKTILAGLQNIKNNLEKEQKILLFVKEKLKNTSNWFLIYDNVEKFADIHKYFPCDPTVWGNGKVIVTTNNSNTKNNSFINNFVQVGELSPQEKLTLFLKIMDGKNFQALGSLQRERANTFLNDVPPYPLDISIAAYYLKSTNTPYGEYLERLKENSKDFNNIQADVVKEASGYTKTRYGIITLSLKELMNIHEDFQDLLLLISLVDYQNIPKPLLAQYKTNTVVDNFIYHLKKYSLITNESSSHSIPTISIHKKTQEIILPYLTNTLHLSDGNPLLHAVTTLVENYILDAVDKEDFSRMKLLAPHGEILLSHDNLLNEAARSSLKGSLGCIYYYLKHYPKIKQFLEENLVHLKHHYGENHDKVACILIYLGNFYRSLGDYERAKTLLKQSLVIASGNPNHLRSAKALGYLGSVYRDSGEYKKAKDLLEQSLVIYKKYSPNSIGHAWILAYLGNTYGTLGEYEKAKVLLEQSFTIYKKQSEDYVGAGWALSHLGTVYRLLGDYKTAKGFIEKALSIAKKYFSDDHIYVASHVYALAKVYVDTGDYQKAKTLLKSSLSVYEANYGRNHIETANVLRMLGEAYYWEGDFEASEEILNKSLFIFQQKNNPESFKSLQSLANLYLKKADQALNEGDTRQAQGFHNQAIHYLTQSLEIIKDSFSGDSPHAKRIQPKLDALIKKRG